MTLPAVDTDEQFDALKPADVLPGATKLAAALGCDEIRRFNHGSLPVYAAGDAVLKLFPPVYAGEADVESGVLRAVSGRLSIPTPEVRETGEVDGWAYVLMSRLDGEHLDVPTPQLAEHLGEALKQLHSVESGGPRPDWQAFISEQRDTCVQRHRKMGVDEHWLAQVPTFLDQDLLPETTDALLHTEVMSAHVLLHNGRLSGLVDFEPAMHGAPEYEFAAIGPFLTKGDGDSLRHLLRAYGYQELDRGLQRRLMAYYLLHKHGDLKRILVPSITTLDELAAHWWRF
nr:aminoglycoside phosphotransferase family protein [Kibdelosporangium sp. MJ126-NF4]CEL21113.1 putative phosphotransferase [Kibdelosporangium sp. MJ126-NF4]CTQ95372.1 putative phosphotransferase [Kibdelosporangium sp. MJ126-NF4]